MSVLQSTSKLCSPRKRCGNQYPCYIDSQVVEFSFSTSSYAKKEYNRDPFAGVE